MKRPGNGRPDSNPTASRHVSDSAFGKIVRRSALSAGACSRRRCRVYRLTQRIRLRAGQYEPPHSTNAVPDSMRGQPAQLGTPLERHQQQGADRETQKLTCPTRMQS